MPVAVGDLHDAHSNSHRSSRRSPVGRCLTRRESFHAVICRRCLGCLPLAGVRPALDGGRDEVGEGVRLAFGHLVEGTPREGTVSAEPARKPEQRGWGGVKSPVVV